MIFGYMRIGTQKEKQKTDRQRITLEQYAAVNNFNFDEILEERISANVQAERRPVYNELKGRIRKDDILIIMGKDIFDINDVHLAIIEPSGNISVRKKPNQYEKRTACIA